MNLNDFNRYAEDFAEKKKVIAGGGLNRAPSAMADMQEQLYRAGFIDRKAQMQMLQQQMAVGSTAVLSSSRMADGMGGLGEIIPLIGTNDE